MDVHRIEFNPAMQSVNPGFPDCQAMDWSRGLKHEDGRVRRCWCELLTAVGDPRAEGQLLRALKDPDASVANAAEIALWSLWIRQGSAQAFEHLRLGCGAMCDGRTARALCEYRRAIRVDPTYGEGHHQWAMAWFHLDRYVECLSGCVKAIGLKPEHFGAWALMGHTHLQMGNFLEARRCYQKALRIHPGMSGVAEVIGHVGQCQAALMH